MVLLPQVQAHSLVSPFLENVHLCQNHFHGLVYGYIKVTTTYQTSRSLRWHCRAQSRTTFLLPWYGASNIFPVSVEAPQLLLVSFKQAQVDKQQGKKMQNLVIDANIRDWVLLPIVGVMFLFGILRHYVTALLKATPRPPELEKYRQAQTLLRAKTLIHNYAMIPASAFSLRKQHLNAKQGGLLHEKIEGMSLTNMTDPNNMAEMMKGNMGALIPNIAMLGFISYFFAGFVVAKFPFPLTNRMRSMVQRGIELNSLDLSYVTSASLYFLILFGLQGLLSLVLGEDTSGQDTQMIQQQTQMFTGAPGAVDMSKEFEAARDNIELVQHTFKLKDAEENLIKLIQK